MSSNEWFVPSAWTALAVLSLFAADHAQAQAPNLDAISVLPQRSQSAEQMRRDRFECHNWAIEQTGSVPARSDAARDEHEQKADRVEKVVTGAGVGAAVGGMVRGGRGRDAADGVIGGAVLGAAVGALLGRNRKSDEETAEATLATPYVRALSACLEGRGYGVVEATDAEST